LCTECHQRNHLETSINSNAPSNHNPALDGFRGLAILLVVLSHSCIPQAESTLSRVWYWVSSAGWVGVDMFFVLSGFLITRILITSRDSRGYYLNFYFRRFLRIFPLFYLFLFVFFIIVPRFSDLAKLFSLTLGHFLWHLLFCSNLLFSKLGFYPGHVVDVSWSLSIEEQFYLFWPALVAFMNLKQLRWVCLLMALVGEVIIVARFFRADELNSTYFFTLTRWDGILFGSALAATMMDPIESVKIRNYKKPVLWISFLLSLLAFSRGIHTTSPLIQMIGFPSFAVFFSSILYFVNFNGFLQRCFSMTPLRTLGKYSYGIYLFHKPTIITLEEAFLPFLKTTILYRVPETVMLLFQIVSVLASLMVAIGLFHCYEKHFLKFKNLLQRESVPPPTSQIQEEGLTGK